MNIKTELVVASTINVEGDLKKEDKDLSILLGGELTKSATLDPTTENDTESVEGEHKVDGEN